MGLLADAFSYGNGLKRKVNGLLSDPMGTIERGVTRLGEDQNKLLALMKDVMPAGRYVAPEVRKNALKELADYGSQVGIALMAIDPKGQKRLVDGLSGKGDGERYRLGDLKPAQAADAYNFSGKSGGESMDVFVSPNILESHVSKTRIGDNRFNANEVGLFAKQAMRPDSVVLPPAKTSDYPLLRSQRVIDPVTGMTYNAEMPLKAVDDGFEAISIIPQGLPARKKPR